MTEKVVKKLRFWFSIIVSVLTVLLGIVFIMQTLAIYQSAEDNPYTYEGVKIALSQISPFVWVWLIAVVLTFVFWCVFPEKVTLKAEKDPEITLEKLYSRFPELKTRGVEEQRKRKLAKIIVLVVLGVGSVVTAVYLCNEANFPAIDGGAHVTEEVLNAVWWVFPIALFTGLVAIGASFYIRNSYQKELLSELKGLIAEKAKREKKLASNEDSNEKKENRSKIVSFVFSPAFLLWARVGVAVVGVVLVVVGILNGGMQDVFAKAVKICTECIGLG
jgi:NADH:ubiquinone oxidoreductase subunit 5 (subunit L)/multisubunit Na+/H+ antiporter MnhA subunit